MRHSIWTAFGLASALSTIAWAQPPARGALTLDVAGVRLAMPYAQAKAAAERSSYSCRSFGTAPTFEEQVAREVDARKGRSSAFPAQTGIAQLICEGPAGEWLRLQLAQLRGGAVVDQIHLSVDQRRADVVAVRRQLAAKYGHPATGVVMPTNLCETGPCNPRLSYAGPRFTIDTAGSVGVRAERGKSAADADLAAVMAAADQVAPRERGAAL